MDMRRSCVFRLEATEANIVFPQQGNLAIKTGLTSLKLTFVLASRQNRSTESSCTHGDENVFHLGGFRVTGV
jgi:hypothetical protein